MSQNWYLVHAESGTTICGITDKDTRFGKT